MSENFRTRDVPEVYAACGLMSSRKQKGGQGVTQPTNIKTSEVKRMLREAGFVLTRGAGAHEIWRKGTHWVRVAAAHRNVGRNEYRAAKRVVERAAHHCGGAAPA
jgi:hypothetical protein